MSSFRLRAPLAAACAIVLLATGCDAGTEDGFATSAIIAVRHPGDMSRFETATLASGCFWCTESDFDAVAGVVRTTPGYTGGLVVSPTYTQVSAGGTGHVEAVQILFDPAVTSLELLLEHYWRNVDFLNDRGQFCDYGEQYRPVIFAHDAEQRRKAEASKARLEQRVGRSVLVEVRDASAFYAAEPYHHDYATRNPLRYRFYRWGCGRDSRLAELAALR